MSLLRRTEKRALSYQDLWGTGGDTSSITGLFSGAARSALTLAPVYSATSLIAGMISTCPMSAYRETPDGARTYVPRQPALVTNPNPYGRRIDWLFQGLTSVLITGNAYGYITALDNAGIPSKIIWLNPTDVTVIEEQHDWFHTPTFYWRGRPLDPALVVHIPGYTLPGSIVGLSPINQFKTQIETGIAAQSFQNDWYKNGASPSGWFQNTADAIQPADAAAIKARFRAAVQNRDLLVTGKDWQWTQLAVPADQAQFLEAIRANATTIASIFHVSPDDIGGEVAASSLTYKTLEQDSMRLVIRALSPWVSKFEEVLTALIANGQDVEFDLSSLTRGTALEQVQVHAAMQAAKLETVDEGRAAYNKPPLTAAQLKSLTPPPPPAPIAPATPADPAADPGKGADDKPAS